ncbi:brachyurin-like [Topomyia yanbarensis]|uniref:brachyurin-like n=1 Tax=Topomyia yanbarensis TaxID=2498891 RepID=UPI00273C757B|nr:brachyurin-like [Topomyia yanbarensis]
MICLAFPVVVLGAILGVKSHELDASPFVINGQIADYVPHNAYILFMTDQLAGFFGGGSLISDRHILTAAQNIKGYSIWDVGLGGDSVFGNQKFYRSVNALTHPQFNATTRDNDVGIIFLPFPIDISGPAIKPISLPSADETAILPLTNEQGYVVGFGYEKEPGPNTVLMQGFQRVTSEPRCAQFYQPRAQERFCAEDATANACNGDIGAGFVTHVRNRQVLMGIASAIMQNCNTGTPTSYTRVKHYLDWIHLIAGPYLEKQNE